MASGDTLLILRPQDNTPPASAFATLDTRNGHVVLDFADATDEEAVFTAIMPAHYDGGGVTARLHYAMSSATSDDVVLTGAFERIGDEVQDIDSDSFATAQTVTDTVPGTNGEVGVASITFTDGAQMDSVAAGESFRFKITRDADDASDDATGDLELLAVELIET